MRIPTSTLLQFIPHRPPMVWIDAISTASDSAGTGFTLIKKGSLFLTDGQLRESTCIELVAQTFAFTNAASMKRNNQNLPPGQRAFLAAIKDFKICAGDSLPIGAEIRIEVKKNRQFGPISLITGHCYYQDRLLASGELKLFSG